MYCCTPKRYTIMRGGLSWTTTSVQYPLGWCDGCHRTTAPVRSPHTSYRWRGERVIEPIKWMGIIRRPWLTRASGGNLARTLFIYLILFNLLKKFSFIHLLTLCNCTYMLWRFLSFCDFFQKIFITFHSLKLKLCIDKSKKLYNLYM